MKKLFGAALVALTLAFTACTTFVPVAAGSGTVGAKRGEATFATVLGCIPIPNNDGSAPDNTMLKAAQNGGIKRIATVDVKIYNILWLYTTTTTIVTGD